MKYIPKQLKTGDKDFSEILKHSAWALIMFGLAAGAQFVFDLLLARNFGAEGAGLFYLAFSVLAVLALVGRLGFNRAVVKYIPKFVKDKDHASLHGLEKTAFKLTTIISTSLGILVFVSAPLIADKVFKQPQLQQYLRWFAIAIPAMSTIFVQAGFLRGLKKIRESVFLERVIVYILGAFSILVLGSRFGLNGAVIGFTFGVLLSSVFGYFLLRKYIPRNSTPKLFNKKTLLLIAAPLLFVEFSNQMTGQLNIAVLGIILDAEAVGVFNIALKVSMLLSVIMTGINAIATTKIAELQDIKHRKKLEIMASKTSALALLLATPLVLVMLIFPDLILGLFGSDFTDGASVLRILVIAQIVNLGVGSVSYLLAMTGYEKSLAVTIGLTVLLLNAVLTFTLVPLFGVFGAGIAVTTTIAVKNIALLYLVKKNLGIWSLPFKATAKWLKIS